MTRMSIGKVLVASALALAAQPAHAISLDLGAVKGAVAANRGSLEFHGSDDSFRFVNATAGADAGFSFRITLSDGVGDSVGDLGNISGTFQIGVVTVAAPLETAPVTSLAGPNIFTIKDHAGFLLTGTVDYAAIYTLDTSGAMNFGGAINLSGITYSGTEADLVALDGAASTTIQFGFDPAKSLTTLKAGSNINRTTFTGDITRLAVPDGGATAMLLGAAFLGLGVVARRKS